MTDKEMKIKNEFMGGTNFHTPEEEIKWLRNALVTEREEHARTREMLVENTKEWLCDKCNTVYPKPAYFGFNSVVCPKCQTATLLPKQSQEIRKLTAELNTARERIKELEEWLRKEIAVREWQNMAISEREKVIEIAESKLLTANRRIKELEKPGAIEQDVLEEFMGYLEEEEVIDPKWWRRNPNIIREFIKEHEAT